MCHRKIKGEYATNDVPRVTMDYAYLEGTTDAGKKVEQAILVMKETAPGSVRAYPVASKGAEEWQIHQILEDLDGIGLGGSEIDGEDRPRGCDDRGPEITRGPWKRQRISC